MAKFRAYILDWSAVKPPITVGDAAAVWPKAIKDGDYNPYNLEASGIEEVFEILNIAHPEDYHLRSLSVGDVVVDLDAGRAFICGPVGWAETDFAIFSE